MVIVENGAAMLPKTILGMNHFNFNSQHFLQIHGTAMGTSMACSYAKLFMGKLEQSAIENAPFKHLMEVY